MLFPFFIIYKINFYDNFFLINLVFLILCHIIAQTIQIHVMMSISIKSNHLNAAESNTFAKNGIYTTSNVNHIDANTAANNHLFDKNLTQ
jgi:hypothetical protein